MTSLSFRSFFSFFAVFTGGATAKLARYSFDKFAELDKTFNHTIDYRVVDDVLSASVAGEKAKKRESTRHRSRTL